MPTKRNREVNRKLRIGGVVFRKVSKRDGFSNPAKEKVMPQSIPLENQIYQDFLQER
jgi:hypothetical protein